MQGDKHATLTITFLAGNIDKMTMFQKVAEGINVGPLVAKLEESPELWGEITARQHAPGSPHGDTEAIFLRWCADWTWQATFDDLRAWDYPAARTLMPEAGHVLTALLTMLGETAELGRVMIVKLKAGGHIRRHMDEGLYADFYDRFHVCLSGECDFMVGHEVFVCRSGEAWWFNHKREHEVWNTSATEDRLHMIVDVAVPKFRAMRGVYFQQERSKDLWPEITPLIAQHYEEIAHHKDIPLDPDVERYNAMDDAGLLRCFTARDCGRLIGYAIFICGPNLHYKSTKIANQDVLFLAPEARNGTTAMRFFDFFEKRLAGEGWQLTMQHEKIAHPALGRLAERRGYEPMDRIWVKRLDR